MAIRVPTAIQVKNNATFVKNCHQPPDAKWGGSGSRAESWSPLTHTTMYTNRTTLFHI